MKMNKFFCMIAVSVVCLCSSAFLKSDVLTSSATTAQAVREAWHVSLNASGPFTPEGGWQIVPDGSGGVACSYYYGLGGPSNAVQWVNAQGHQIYSCAMDSEFGSYFTIIGLDKSHLVYSIDPTGCVVVDKLGRETHVANSQAPLYNQQQPTQPLHNDKNGFFIIRYTGDGADGELVRFLYK